MFLCRHFRQHILLVSELMLTSVQLAHGILSITDVFVLNEGCRRDHTKLKRCRIQFGSGIGNQVSKTRTSDVH